MKKIVILIFFTLFGRLSFSQDYLGFSHSRFAGVMGVEVNPASILTDDLKSDWLFPIGFDLSTTNNVVSYQKEKALGIRSFENGKLRFDVPNNTGAINGRIKANGLGIMIRLSEDHAFALSTKSRAYLSIKGNKNAASLINADFFDLFDDPFNSFISQGLATDAEFSVTSMAWDEYSLTYSRKIWENKYDVLKIGATAKVLRGLYALHGDLNIRELKITLGVNTLGNEVVNELTDFFENADDQEIEDFLNNLDTNSNSVIVGDQTYNLSSLGTIDGIFDFSGQFDYSSNIFDQELSATKILRNMNNWGVGLDIGFVYEFKENPKGFTNYIRKRIHKPVHSRRGDPPYKWKLGVSVMDIGRIKFDRGKNTYKSNGGKTVEIVDLLDTNSVDQLNEIEGDFNDFINDPENNQDSIQDYNDLRKTSGQFSVGLPTTLNVDWDYHWKKALYLNVNAWVSMAALKWSDHTVRNISKLNVTPRVEKDAVAVFLPLSVNYLGQFNMGFAFRTGPLMLGVQNLGPVLFQKKVNRFGVYFAFAKGFAVKKKTDESKSIYFRNEMKRYNRR